MEIEDWPWSTILSEFGRLSCTQDATLVDQVRRRLGYGDTEAVHFLRDVEATGRRRAIRAAEDTHGDGPHPSYRELAAWTRFLSWLVESGVVQDADAVEDSRLLRREASHGQLSEATSRHCCYGQCHQHGNKPGPCPVPCPNFALGGSSGSASGPDPSPLGRGYVWGAVVDQDDPSINVDTRVIRDLSHNDISLDSDSVFSLGKPGASGGGAVVGRSGGGVGLGGAINNYETTTSEGSCSSGRIGGAQTPPSTIARSNDGGWSCSSITSPMAATPPLDPEVGGAPVVVYMPDMFGFPSPLTRSPTASRATTHTTMAAEPLRESSDNGTGDSTLKAVVETVESQLAATAPLSAGGSVKLRTAVPPLAGPPFGSRGIVTPAACPSLSSSASSYHIVPGAVASSTAVVHSSATAGEDAASQVTRTVRHSAPPSLQPQQWQQAVVSAPCGNGCFTSGQSCYQVVASASVEVAAASHGRFASDPPPSPQYSARQFAMPQHALPVCKTLSRSASLGPLPPQAQIAPPGAPPCAPHRFSVPRSPLLSHRGVLFQAANGRSMACETPTEVTPRAEATPRSVPPAAPVMTPRLVQIAPAVQRPGVVSTVVASQRANSPLTTWRVLG